ncbi:MAG: hypothetical protein LBJ63_05320 [Prevotellaceae bacterium]|jgi:hypothetical protein|nr:hypothetical protein [Prevotellaceae bacterium]
MLITADDIRKHRSVSLNLDDEKRLLTYIDEAEKLDIMPVIGVELYKDLHDNPQNHDLLLNGGYYDGEKRYCIGIKAADALLSYARFILNNSVNATPFGVQRKNALDSESVDDKTLYRHSNEAKNVGMAYLQQCVDFITFNTNSCGQHKKEIHQRKIRVIGE